MRTTERPFTTWLFRAAGSAGARFPLELYVAAPEGAGLPAGVHWYDPLDHALVPGRASAARRCNQRRRDLGGALVIAATSLLVAPQAS